MTATDIKIVKVTEERPIGPEGKVMPEVVLTFTVGTHGPFTERGTKAEFDSGVLAQRVTTFVQKLANLPGIA